MAFLDNFCSSPSAQHQFTNREKEQTAFDKSLSNYFEQIHEIKNSADGQRLDYEEPRQNVLSFYGVGGIGKSELHKKLIDRISVKGDQPDHWPEVELNRYPLAFCKFDMESFHREDALLLLRSSVANLKGSFPAFDLCLSTYWSAVHPESTIINAFKQRSRLAGVASSLHIGEQIQAVAEDISSALLGVASPAVWGGSAISYIGTALWKSIKKKYALEKCAYLDDLLKEVCDQKKLGQLAYALSWDLENIQKKTGSGLVVFVDTMEKAGESAENFINTIAWMMPNALFVIAGRNSLTWADATSEVVFNGEKTWPNLLDNSYLEPRQHLVGYLSMEDRYRWLDLALKNSCSKEVIDCIAEESQGLPVHLDLILQHVWDISQEREVRLEDVEGDLGAVAKRVLRDLSDVQRRALLATSLFPRFDIEMIRVIAGLSNSGPVEELCSKPYVDKLETGMYSYKLHEELRRVFIAASGLGDDQWSNEDWCRAGYRGAELLHDRLCATDDSLDYMEHAELLLGLVDVFGFDLEWLPGTVAHLTKASNWSDTWIAGAEPTRRFRSSWSTDLSIGTAIIMTRQGRDRAEVAEDLRKLLDNHQGDKRFDIVRYFLSQALLDIGDTKQSREVVESLLNGEMRDRALRGLIHACRREGDFKSVKKILKANKSLYARNRVLGEMRWLQGRLSEAQEYFRIGERDAQSLHDGGEAALCVAYQAWCCLLLNKKKEAACLVEKARCLLKSSHVDFAYLLCFLTEALAAALEGEGLEQLNEVAAKAAVVGGASIVAYAHFSKCLVCVVAGDDEAAQVASKEFREAVDNKSFAYLTALGSVLMDEGQADNSQLSKKTVVLWQEIFSSLRKGRSG